MGLVPLIAGSKIANIEQDAAHLITPGGSRQTFLRCLRSGDTCLWDLPNERGHACGALVMRMPS
jgi:hypothetical protein